MIPVKWTFPAQTYWHMQKYYSKNISNFRLIWVFIFTTNTECSSYLIKYLPKEIIHGYGITTILLLIVSLKIIQSFDVSSRYFSVCSGVIYSVLFRSDLPRFSYSFHAIDFFPRFYWVPCKLKWAIL